MFLVAVLGAFIILFTLGTVLGVDMSLKTMFEALASGAAALIEFLTNFLEGLA